VVGVGLVTQGGLLLLDLRLHGVLGRCSYSVVVLPLAVFYYGYLRVTRMRSGSSEQYTVDQRLQVAPLLAYLGSATLVLFAQFYFYTGPALIAWAALALLFIGVAGVAKLNIFLHHSVLLAFLVFFRAIAFDFFAVDHSSTVGERSTVVLCCRRCRATLCWASICVSASQAI
jgi:hypothetical protein